MTPPLLKKLGGKDAGIKITAGNYIASCKSGAAADDLTISAKNSDELQCLSDAVSDFIDAHPISASFSKTKHVLMQRTTLDNWNERKIMIKGNEYNLIYGKFHLFRLLGVKINLEGLSRESTEGRRKLDMRSKKAVMLDYDITSKKY